MALKPFSKKSFLNKIAAERYWIDPNGKVYQVSDTHEDWILDNIKLLQEQYGLWKNHPEELYPEETDNTKAILPMMLRDGWSRVGDLFGSGRSFIGQGIEVADITNVPNSAFSFMSNFSSGKYFMIEDLRHRWVELSVDEINSDGQDAINQALRRERLKKSYADLAPFFNEKLREGEPYAVFLGNQEDGMGGSFPLYDIYGNHPRFGSTVGLETLQELGIPIREKKMAKVTTKPTSEKINFRGIEIVIEWPKGSIRTFDRSDAKTEMQADYGRIDNTKGKDKEEIDVYVNRTDTDEEGQDATHVYKVKQVKKGEDKIDEYKYMLGFRNKEQAEKIYLEHIPKDFFGGIEEMTFDEFAKFIDKNQEKNEVVAEFLPSFVNAPDNNWQFDEGGPDKEIGLDPDPISDEETWYSPCTEGKPRSVDTWDQMLAIVMQNNKNKEASSTISPSISDYKKHNVSPMGFSEIAEFQNIAPKEIQDHFDDLLDADKLEEAYILLEKYTHPFRMAANKKIAIEEFDEKLEQKELGENETLLEYEKGFKDLNRQNTNKPKTLWNDNSSSQGGEPYAALPSFHVETNPANEGQNSPGGYPNRFCVRPQGDSFSNEGEVDNILVQMFKDKEACLNALTKEASIEDIDGLPVFVNPTENELKGFSRNLKGGHMFRGLLDPHTGDLFVWDAYEAIHTYVIQKLGLDVKYSDSSPFCLYFPPSDIYDALARQQDVKRGRPLRPTGCKKQAGNLSTCYTDDQMEKIYDEQHMNNTDEEPYVNHDQRDYPYGMHDSPENTDSGIGWAKDNEPNVVILDKLNKPFDRVFPGGLPTYEVTIFDTYPMSDGMEV